MTVVCVLSMIYIITNHIMMGNCTVAVNNYCLQSQIVLLGDSLDKLDRSKLSE